MVAVEEGLAPALGPLHRVLRGAAGRLWGGSVRHTVSHLVALDVVAKAQAMQQGYPVEHVEVLSAGIDLSRYRPDLRSDRLVGHGVQGPLLLCTEPLEEGRGLDDLLRGFARTVGRREDWNLAFAGDGTYRAALRAHAARLGIGAQVHWIGALREEELPGVLGQSTLLVVPGPDSATSARVMRGAMACGLPILANDEPRFRELVQDDRNGLLVNSSAPEDWVRCLERATLDPASRERWGGAARAMAEERFAWPRIAARFSEILADAVQQTAEAHKEPAPETSRWGGFLRRRA